MTNTNTSCERCSAVALTHVIRLWIGTMTVCVDANACQGRVNVVALAELRREEAELAADWAREDAEDAAFYAEQDAREAAYRAVLPLLY